MKKQLLFVLIPFLLLTSCASNRPSVKHDVALSFDSERIAYNVIGNGNTTLIFVHGWSCDGRYWHKQVPAFANEYQIITVDLAGHGHSSLNRSNFSTLSFAKDVKAVIDKENVNKAILVGHSMGGGVITEVTRLMPEKIVGIIGIDALKNVGDIIHQSAVDDIAKPFETDFKSATKEFVSLMLPKTADQQLATWLIEDMSSAPKDIALSAFRNHLGQYVNGEAAAVFKDITTPVVSIDAKVWPTMPDKNRKHINDYQLFYIEDTGHFPMLEKPEEFNTLLKKAINLIEAKDSKKPASE